MKLTLSPRAERDLDSIFEASVLKWGETQAKRYAEKIETRFDLLLQFPNAGRTRRELGDGVRSIPIGAHIVFYKVNAGGVLILSVRDARKQSLTRLEDEG